MPNIIPSLLGGLNQVIPSFLKGKKDEDINIEDLKKAYELYQRRIGETGDVEAEIAQSQVPERLLTDTEMGIGAGGMLLAKLLGGRKAGESAASFVSGFLEGRKAQAERRERERTLKAQANLAKAQAAQEASKVGVSKETAVTDILLKRQEAEERKQELEAKAEERSFAKLYAIDQELNKRIADIRNLLPSTKDSVASQSLLQKWIDSYNTMVSNRNELASRLGVSPIEPITPDLISSWHDEYRRGQEDTQLQTVLSKAIPKNAAELGVVTGIIRGKLKDAYKRLYGIGEDDFEKTFRKFYIMPIVTDATMKAFDNMLKEVNSSLRIWGVMSPTEKAAIVNKMTREVTSWLAASGIDVDSEDGQSILQFINDTANQYIPAGIFTPQYVATSIENELRLSEIKRNQVLNDATRTQIAYTQQRMKQSAEAHPYDIALKKAQLEIHPYNIALKQSQIQANLNKADVGGADKVEIQKLEKDIASTEKSIGALERVYSLMGDEPTENFMIQYGITDREEAQVRWNQYKAGLEKQIRNLKTVRDNQYNQLKSLKASSGSSSQKFIPLGSPGQTTGKIKGSTGTFTMIK